MLNKFKKKPIVYVSYNELANDVQFEYEDGTKRYINVTYKNLVNIDKIRQETAKLAQEGYKIKIKKDRLKKSNNEIDKILKQQVYRLNPYHTFYLNTVAVLAILSCIYLIYIILRFNTDWHFTIAILNSLFAALMYSAIEKRN